MYSVTWLGMLPAAPDSGARGMNQTRDVVGGSTTGIGDAWLWHAGTMQSLGILPGFAGAFGNAVNKHRHVVGACINAPLQDSGAAFLWKAGMMTELPLPAGFTHGAATAINDRGDIVGFANETATLRRRAILWPHGGAPTALPLPANASSSQAHDITDDPTPIVAGSVFGVAFADPQPCLWEGGVPTIPPLYAGPLPAPISGTVAGGVVTAINRNGQMAGVTFIEDPFNDQVFRPCVWPSATTAPVLLELPAGWIKGTVFGLDDAANVLAGWFGGAPGWVLGATGPLELEPPDVPSVVTQLHVASMDGAGRIAGAASVGGHMVAVLLEPIAVLPRRPNLPAAWVRILWGVVNDGGGVVLGPHGPEPVGPWGPLVLRDADPVARDAIVALALDDIAAHMLGDQQARHAVREMTASVLARAAERLRHPGARTGVAGGSYTSPALDAARAKTPEK